jgi:hypothetical protein
MRTDYWMVFLASAAAVSVFPVYSIYPQCEQRIGTTHIACVKGWHCANRSIYSSISMKWRHTAPSEDFRHVWCMHLIKTLPSVFIYRMLYTCTANFNCSIKADHNYRTLDRPYAAVYSAQAGRSPQRMSTVEWRRYRRLMVILHNDLYVYVWCCRQMQLANNKCQFLVRSSAACMLPCISSV